MNKGIVLKIHSHSIIVLTPDGKFLKCKRLLSSYEIGEEIQFPSHAVIVNNKAKMFMPKLVPVMIASVLMIISFVLVDFSKKRVQAAGYVNIESKAKVSLILDKQLKVIALKAQNEQGKKIIAELKDWKQEPVKDVTKKLMVQLEENQIIQHDEKVLISGSMDKKFSKEQKKLRTEIDHIKQSNTHFNNEHHSKNEHSAKDKQKQKDTKNKRNKKNGGKHQSGNKKNTIKNDSKIEAKQRDHKSNKNKENKNHSKRGNGYNNKHHRNKKQQENKQNRNKKQQENKNQRNKKQQENKHKHENKKNDSSRKNNRNDKRGNHVGKGNQHSKDRKQNYQNQRKKDSTNQQNNRKNKDQGRERKKDRDHNKRKR